MSFSLITQGFDHVLIEVLTALSPVLVLFLIFLLIFKLPKEMLLSLFKGVLFAFAGLALFLQGVKVGFLPVGNEMGAILGGLPHRWILIPLGFILGFVATLAEPAVRILCEQVEKSSSGSIRSNTILYTLCLAVGIFIALGMVRIVYGIPFYYIIIPGYLLAIILMFLSKPSFTAVAFDSGGVATGPMTVTFIMAMAVGAADNIEGRDAVIDGFGLIAMVALAPIIMVMLLGFLYPPDQENSIDPDQVYYEPENGHSETDLPDQAPSESSPESEPTEQVVDEEKSLKDESDLANNENSEEVDNNEDNSQA
ncbi:MAG: DUF1538 domain-containing protein [Bacillota bacterium]